MSRFILWESDRLSSWSRTTYPLGFGTSSVKRDMGIGPLILWESGIWEMDFNLNPLFGGRTFVQRAFVQGISTLMLPDKQMCLSKTVYSVFFERDREIMAERQREKTYS